MAADAHGLPIDFIITGGEVHDCKVASEFIGQLPTADYTIADKGYDKEALRERVKQKTSKTVNTKKVMLFHCGRGSQEGIIGELKSQCGLDYIPFRNKAPNQLYLFSGIIAHNLNRELQMVAYERDRSTTEKRPSLWIFQELNTIRKNIIQRAGRLTRPQGKLKLTMNLQFNLVNGKLLYMGVV